MGDVETPRLLLVDDEKLDIRAIKRAIAAHESEWVIEEAYNGEEALEILESGERHPYLVLLDLNMPRMNGFEFLDVVRKSPPLHRTVIFVHTTSSADRDRLMAYDYNVAGYLIKTTDPAQAQRQVELLANYVAVNEFPPSQELKKNSSLRVSEKG